MSESTKGVLLIVEDEPLKRTTLRIELMGAGYQVIEAPDALTALQVLGRQSVDVVISDLRLPGMNGLQFLDRVKADSPQTHVIMMTAYGSVDTAVQAIKRGAYDYLTKPFQIEQLLGKLDHLRACQTNRTGGGTIYTERLGKMAARSYGMRRLFEQVRKTASSNHAILIQAEPGTNTEQIAETIHELSSRAAQPMLKLNATATPSHQLDTALFAPNTGAFAAAQGGTLFIDGVDALPEDLQASLLHVLTTGTLPLTFTSTQIDVRLLCATRTDLRRLVDEGRCNEDLYYRLTAITLTVPPLRDRPEDIPLLAEQFAQSEATKSGNGAAAKQFTPHALDMLMSYHWPGNAAELERVVARAVTFAETNEIQAKDILLPAADTAGVPEPPVIPEGVSGLTEAVAGVEKTLIDNALRRVAGNQAKAAQLLGIPRTTLRDKMAKYGIGASSPNRQTVG
jgi:DNA-binding NtrC family response regulator